MELVAYRKREPNATSIQAAERRAVQQQQQQQSRQTDGGFQWAEKTAVVFEINWFYKLLQIIRSFSLHFLGSTHVLTENSGYQNPSQRESNAISVR